MIVDISIIKVGDRRREEMGDIAGLAKSIKKWGLLQPIVIDSENNLVAGGRRLEAVKRLGEVAIEATDLGDLSEGDRRALELEENEQRKALTDFERAKSMVAKAAQTADVLSSKLEDKTPRGHKRQHAAPKSDIAEAMGVGVGSLVRAEQHVEAAESYPFMRQPEWKQYHVLEARERIAKLPEPERPKAAALVGQPAIPPKDAIKILANLGEMPEERRGQIYALSASDDSRERSLALTTAAEMTPEPDPRTIALTEAIRYLEKAEDRLKVCVKGLPSDPLAPRFRDALAGLKSLREDVRAHHSVREQELSA